MGRMSGGRGALLQGKLDEYAGPPLSVLWRGGAVHLRTGAGAGGGPGHHAHFAIQLTVGLREPIRFRPGRIGATRLAPAWLVGSDRPHWMDCGGAAATLFFDPLFSGGRRLALRLAGRSVLALSDAEAEAVRREMEACCRRGWTLPDLRAAAGRIVDAVAPATAQADSLDPRVRMVVRQLMSDSSENVGLPELAAGAGLSESRLAHLFRRDVGIPMRQYRLSLRMVAAVTCIARGRSLTEAAHEAGFSDSAHFCRICRRMYGSAPSRLPEFETE